MKSVHKRRIGRTGIRSTRCMHSTASASTSTSSSSLLQFCPPRLNHSRQLQKLLECGPCSMSPLCVVPAIQTSEIHGNSVGTRQQLMASVKTRHQRLLWYCGSHIHVASPSAMNPINRRTPEASSTQYHYEPKANSSTRQQRYKTSKTSRRTLVQPWTPHNHEEQTT